MMHAHTPLIVMYMDLKGERVGGVGVGGLEREGREKGGGLEEREGGK